MPYYTYRCVACGHAQTEKSSIEDRAQYRCCEPCSQPAKLVPSASNFVLRGDGWPGKEISRV